MRPEFKYGLIGGAGMCLWFTIEQLLGWHTTHVAVGEYSRYFSCVVLLPALFLLLRQKQASRPARPLDIGEGLATGLLASFFAALFVYCFLAGYSQFFNPGWLDHALDWKVTQLRAQNVSEVEIRQVIVFYRKLHSPAGLILTVVLGLTLIGGLFSLGLTCLVSRQRR